MIKVTSKGALAITLSRNEAELVKPVLGELIARLENLSKAWCMLNNDNAQIWVYLDLMQAVYVKYYTELDLLKEKYKVTLTKAQATALWHLGQQYQSVVYCHPLMNNVMASIHRKLS